MKKLVSFFVILPLLAACVKVPIAAKVGDSLLQGDATGTLVGTGSFTVQNIDGLICSGKYNSLNQSLTIQTTLQCNDGRSGRIIIVRDKTLQNGTGQGKLNDGTPVKFAFGENVGLISLE